VAPSTGLIDAPCSYLPEPATQLGLGPLAKSGQMSRITPYATTQNTESGAVVSVRHACWPYSAKAQVRASAASGIRGTNREVWPLNVGQVYTTLQRLRARRPRPSRMTPPLTRDRRRASTSPRRVRPSLPIGCAPRPDLSSPPARRAGDQCARRKSISLRRCARGGAAAPPLLVELMQQWTRLKETSPAST